MLIDASRERAARLTSTGDAAVTDCLRVGASCCCGWRKHNWGVSYVPVLYRLPLQLPPWPYECSQVGWSFHGQHGPSQSRLAGVPPVVVHVNSGCDQALSGCVCVCLGWVGVVVMCTYVLQLKGAHKGVSMCVVEGANSCAIQHPKNQAAYG